MARRGPKPKDWTTWTPRALEGEPRPPDDLDDVARAAWDRLLEVLRPLGTLCRADRDCLILYATTWATWKRAEDAVAELGVVIPTDSGVRSNPACAAARDARGTLIRLFDALGLTPAARMGMKPDRPGDALADFLAGRN